MSLLELDGVRKAYGRGSSRRVVLDDVSLRVDGGELVAIWGLRRSGRSTLLRIAAGLEPPDAGSVRLGGHELSGRDGDELRGQIGYCRRSFGPSDGRAVLDQLMLSQIARGATPPEAMLRVRSALARVDAGPCAELKPGELGAAEAARVMIARALAARPRLLVVDEPTLGIDATERDQIVALLRSLADDGVAVLTSNDKTAGLAGADQALSLSDGELRGGEVAAELAVVVPLHRSAAGGERN
jgi:ABC-type multidrug transport system ATPase subunit